jgi:hypothetical protein
LYFPAVAGSPQQGGCTRLVCRIHIRSVVQQGLDKCYISYDDGQHERRCAILGAGIDIGAPAEQLLHAGTIAGGDRFEKPSGPALVRSAPARRMGSDQACHR